MIAIVIIDMIATGTGMITVAGMNGAGMSGAAITATTGATMIGATMTAATIGAVAGDRPVSADF